MGAIFDNTNTKFLYIYHGTQPITATPLSIIVWLKFTGVATDQSFVNLEQDTTAPNYWGVSYNTGVSKFLATTRNPTTEKTAAAASTSTSTSNWYMAHGTWAGSDASRTVGYNGTQGTAESTTCALTVAPNYVHIGLRGGPNDPANANIAYVAIYNTDISAHLSALYTKKPSDHAASYASCVAFWDFSQATNQLNDLKGSFNLSNEGTVTFNTDAPTFSTLLPLMGQAIF